MTVIGTLNCLAEKKNETRKDVNVLRQRNITFNRDVKLNF